MQSQTPPFLFWAIAIVGLLWNLIGCWNYIVQTNAEAIAQMPEVYRVLIENRPDWATAGFAVSVFGGAVGSILLLLRKRVAVGVFILSLLGTVAVFYFSMRVLGLEPATGSALLMSLALALFAQVSLRKGWIG